MNKVPNLHVAVNRDCLFERSGYKTDAVAFASEEELLEYIKDNPEYIQC